MDTIKLSYLVPAGLLACAGATPVQAGPVSKPYPVSGKVVSGCTVSQLTPIVLSTTVPNNGKLDPTLEGRSWTIASLTCNGASRITVSARALRLNAPKASLNPSQSQTINFTATATGWTTAPATVTTAETTTLGTGALFAGSPQVQSQARSAAINVKVTGFTVVSAKNHDNDAKPVDGPYSATITIAIVPNV